MSTARRSPTRDAAEAPAAPPEPDLIRREREALHEALRLVSERAAAEEEVEGARASGDAAADRSYREALRALDQKIQELREDARRADERRRRAIVDAALAGETEAKTEFAQASRQIAAEFDGVRERARQEHHRAKSAALAAFEAGEREAAAKHAEAVRPVDEALALVDAMRARLSAVFETYRSYGVVEPAPSPTREVYRADNPVGLLYDRLARIDPDLALLEALWIPKSVKGGRAIWTVLVAFAMLAVPSLLLEGGVVGVAGAAVGAIGLGLLLRAWLIGVARGQLLRHAEPVAQALVDAEALAAHCRTQVDDRLKAQRIRVTQKRDDDLSQAKQRHATAIALGEEARDERLRLINEVYAGRMTEIQTRQQVELREAIAAYERRQAEIPALYESNLRKIEERYRDVKAKVRARYESSWDALATRWRGGMERVRAELETIAAEVDRLGPRWEDASWADRPFARDVPPVVRFGEVRVDLDRLPRGISADPRLREGLPTSLTFPALRPFPERANLVVEAPAEGRSAAIGALQAAMLRLLTSLPPGRVRFTIVDPLGIGRNFGAFMHLADFDGALVTDQVWTDPRQIDERLADLAAHMEKVTQKYLRNEYATIEDYNAVAGEVAEPYRVLVLADFPAHFDEKTAARLAGIAAGGLPCGVIVLAAVDRDSTLPGGITPDDLRAGAVALAWEDGRLTWDDPDFGAYPLSLDPPPPAEVATRLIHRAGAAARDAKRVEVPFAFIAPPDDAWWSKDSRAGIDVPLGKAGATKRQNLTLGQGTSQHVLIAGRTGSGKSTLLHALITNLALNYSPDQIDLYLIDFKKGVEFKVYAARELPHASVVAIESEREFGISVLQRLDAELRARADRFRDAGVQDLHGYRNASGTPPLPRILLVVDEFQEFFVEEDRVAQEAALLLDRLVRQGRAFGVHVLLGSQTLGGAYALARSTLGQMAVRVALQCSEADAHLILSETNPAARLLSRPGEAIYNDANGLPEGNHFFQVVWLGDARREAYLGQVADLARARPPILRRTPIVFEGDAPAELPRNPLLRALLDAPAWPPSPRSAQAWLGDAVAIKDPTAALFRRMGGSHLLVVGQDDEAALGVMAAALVGLAAQYPPAEADTVRLGARFAILDGTPEDHPRADALARLAGLLPHPVEVGGWREVPRIMAAVAEEVARRQQPGAADGPEVFLLIRDLPRLRDLRRREDDYGFARRDEEAGPADHLAAILREGPGLGVHLLVWCDTLNNLQRVFDHQALREFEMRVLFQMSPTDSGHLLDAPHASRLGPHRAYFSSEEQNRLEKFRPYGPPAEEWLRAVGERFRSRVAAVP